MENNSEENLTTRSLLKGILATEIVRPAVKHQTKLSVSRASVSLIHQDKTPSSPSMTLRSHMKARVRRSIGKLALEDSYVKRSVNKKIKKKPAINGFQNIVEELNNITPQSLLKKIIQNEDEVSIVVSQRSKIAIDLTEQEGTPETELSSLSNVNLSLPDQQDTAHLDVFRISHKKKSINISQFEREVDEKLPQNRDNSNNLKENVEDLAPLVNTNVRTRSFGDHLDFSIDPQSTYKRPLLRKPNKAFLVSLGDFEQGVEDKYHLLKGSQECFIESTVEDKSSISTRGVAELNTELYVPPLLSELNTSGFKQRLMSNSPVSSDEQNMGTDDMALQKNSANISINVSAKDVLQVTQTTELTNISETTKMLNTTVEDVEQLNTNKNMQKSLPVGEVVDSFESDQNIDKLVSAVKNISHFRSEEEQNTKNSGSIIEDAKHTGKSIDNSLLILGNARPLQLHQSLSKSLLMGKDGSPIKPYSRMEKSELVQGNDGPFGSNVYEDDEMMGTGNRAQPLQTVLTEGNAETDNLPYKRKNSEFDKENDHQYTESLNVSRQEDDSEFSQDHISEKLHKEESTMEGSSISPEYQAKVNKQSMISALIETPAYIKNARLKIPPNKLVAGKKVQKKTALKKKRDESPFKSSLVKQLFSLHAKMRLSKEASSDVENVLEMFLDQMTDDLAAYAAHANRKTITLADLELLMKRQRLVTDASSFNALIERHLPLECRKCLISCAMSGNKVFPKM